MLSEVKSLVVFYVSPLLGCVEVPFLPFKHPKTKKLVAPRQWRSDQPDRCSTIARNLTRATYSDFILETSLFGTRFSPRDLAVQQI